MSSKEAGQSGQQELPSPEEALSHLAQMLGAGGRYAGPGISSITPTVEQAKFALIALAGISKRMESSSRRLEKATYILIVVTVLLFIVTLMSRGR